MIRPMRVTVTGADSLGGAAIARRLAEAGFLVRRTTRLTHEPVGREGAGERVALDFLLPDTLVRAFDGADAAVIITPEQDAMVLMTENLAAAAERTGCTRLVHISFLQGDTGPAGTLMEWHLVAERIIQESPLESTCLRPNHYMQSRLLARMHPASLGAGRVSYVDIRDVAEVTARVLSEPGHIGKTYSLTGPHALSMPEVAELLGHAPRAEADAPGLSWQYHCFEERRSRHSLLDQALCEHWIAASEDQFATVTPDVERLTGHAPRDFRSLVAERRRRHRAGVRRRG
jgi:uncharacterized protein YbjT (DUF2867 family)